MGLALSIYLELRVTVEPDRKDFSASLNCEISYEGQGAEEVSRNAEENLITRVAIYVLKCHGQNSFPYGTHLHIINPIPLGRGLGSSGAAVVGGVMLGNEIGNLGLSKARMLDYCLMIERHPDNVAAALYGGLVATYLNELDPADTQRKEIPLAEVLPQPAGGEDTGLRPPEPPLNIGHFRKLPWAKEIKCIAIIPDFEVPTSKAREVLPTQYSRADLVFNIQRAALLLTALGESPPDPDMIYQGMQDKVHQPYRKGLIPRLTEILSSVTPNSHPGLLGICLSGAGPTILALATHNFESIAEHLLSEFQKENITSEWMLLEPAYDGATATKTQPAAASAQPEAGLTYASAGVSIDRGNALVQRIKAAVAATRRPGADAQIGGFGGAVDLAAAGYGAEAPIIVSAIDGVGTKLKIAFAMRKYDTVGIDLVAMNVNDLVVQGAEPVAFVDYFACSRLDVDVAASFVEGVAEGCRRAGAALVGGETAEMPGMYEDGEFDAAGQATGAIRQGQKVLPDVEAMQEGDAVLGLASTGCHSNGFSLVRKVLERKGIGFDDPAPWDGAEGQKVGEALLEPTKIYVKSCLAVTKRGLVKGMAHITGGGLYDNIPRMLPKHLEAEVDAKTWKVPPVLLWLKRAGVVDGYEFARAWNTGLGMVLVVEQSKKEMAKEILEEYGEVVYDIGRLQRRGDESEGCVVRTMDVWES